MKRILIIALAVLGLLAMLGVAYATQQPTFSEICACLLP